MSHKHCKYTTFSTLVHQPHLFCIQGTQASSLSDRLLEQINKQITVVKVHLKTLKHRYLTTGHTSSESGQILIIRKGHSGPHLTQRKKTPLGIATYLVHQGTSQLTSKMNLALSPFSTSTVPQRSVFCCFKVISSTRVLMKQRNTLRFGTIRSKWKTGLRQSKIHPARVRQSKNINVTRGFSKLYKHKKIVY